MNTGIQEAHNLTWKMAAVVKGIAGHSLLETYATEREPVGRWVVDQTLRNLLSVLNATQSGARTGETKPSTTAGRPEFFNELGLIFGATYQSSVVIPDGSPDPSLSNPATQYSPSARPGSRAPHVWFFMKGQRVSTTDLLGPFMLLLTGEKGGAWHAAATEIGKSCKILRSYTIGRTCDLIDEESSWSHAFEIDSGGAVLIRPDGYVSWRRRTAAQEARQELSNVLSRTLQVGLSAGT